jgi:hypothetical protein
LYSQYFILYDISSRDCRYLESKMLEEVCSAIGLLGLGTGTSVNPHANGRGLRERRVFGGNLDPMKSQHDYHEAIVGGQLALDRGTHGQPVLESRGLHLANVGSRREATSQDTGGHQASTASQALRQVQS